MPLDPAEVHIDHSGTEIGIAIGLGDSVGDRSGMERIQICGLLSLAIEAGVIENLGHHSRLPSQLLSRGRKMVSRILHRSEVGELKFVEVEGLQPIKGLPPNLGIKFRGGQRQGHPRCSGDPHARDVAGEAALPAIDHGGPGVMMSGVAWCLDRGEFEAIDRDRLAVCDGMHLRARAREHFPKDLCEVRSIDATGTLINPGRVDKMSDAKGMHVDVGAVFGEPASGAAVVEMDVGEEDCLDRRRVDPVFDESGLQSLKGGEWSGLDEHMSSVALEYE